jgi:Branched-chain amino acid ATP-binding cassette transporter
MKRAAAVAPLPTSDIAVSHGRSSRRVADSQQARAGVIAEQVGVADIGLQHLHTPAEVQSHEGVIAAYLGGAKR